MFPRGARGRAAGRFRFTIALLVVLAASGAWWFVAQQNIREPAAIPEAAQSAPAVPPPPFHIKGTLLAGATRAAIISVLSAEGKEGPEQRVAEGEVLAGYRLERINMHRVYFEKDGARFMLVVGGSRPEAEPDTTRGVERRDINANIVPPPAGMDIEAERRRFEELLGKMQQDPRRQEMREKRRREMGDRLEPSPWGARPSPEAPPR